MRRTLSVLFALLLLSIPLEAGATITKGDVNGDGNVSIADVTALIDYLLTGDTSAVILENADVSSDGLISIADVTALIDLLLSGSWEPPYIPQTETFTVNGVSFTMVVVEGGTFMMGATDEQGSDPEDDEYPVHEVTLSTYSIGQTEVTQELWAAVMSWRPDSLLPNYDEWIYPSYFSSKNGYTDNPQRPVESVHYYQVGDFLTKLNLLTGRNFRLPTDAEWEFAARGGNLSRAYKYAGSYDIDKVAWYWDNIPSQASGTDGYGTQPVATKAPNELGLYDMSGNVWEKTSDRYPYTYPSEPQTNPAYPLLTPGSSPSGRGGCYRMRPKYCRVSTRLFYAEGGANDSGLRLAL